MTEVVPDAVVAATLSCPGVAGMAAGRFGEATTYLPGRKVTGVRLVGDGEVEVHIVARWGSFLPDVAAAVGSAVRATTGLRASVHVDDIELPEEAHAAP